MDARRHLRTEWVPPGRSYVKSFLRGVEARPPLINETARMARARGRVGARTHRPGSGHHQASSQDAIAVGSPITFENRPGHAEAILGRAGHCCRACRSLAERPTGSLCSSANFSAEPGSLSQSRGAGTRYWRGSLPERGSIVLRGVSGVVVQENGIDPPCLARVALFPSGSLNDAFPPPFPPSG